MVDRSEYLREPAVSGRWDVHGAEVADDDPFSRGLMNEEEWLSSVDPKPMLDYVRGKRASDRKLRLYAVACCRRIWDFLTDERSRKAVEVAEEYADGSVDRERLVAARDKAREVKKTFSSPSQTPFERAANAALDATRDTGRSASNNAPSEAARALNFEDHNRFEEGKRRQQAVLLRCMFGNPFRPVFLDSAWLTPNVVSLAQTIYDNRAFERMPILGDAIEETGCGNTNAIDHCRSQTEHVRGCWVVDALIGKN